MREPLSQHTRRTAEAMAVPLPEKPPRTAVDQVPTPTPVRFVASALVLLGLLLLIGLVALPWQQTAPGVGQVIAYAPADRQQVLEAPVKGLIDEWMVSEGDTVKAGQDLVVLRDNDPEYFTRLGERADRVRQQVQAARAKVEASEARLEAERLAQELSVAEYHQKVLEHRQKLVGEQAELDVAQRNLVRTKTLADEGIQSTRYYEVALGKQQKAAATVEARMAAIAGAEQARDKAREAGASKVAKARGDVEAARSDLASYEDKLLDMATKQARQATQRVTAPRDGVVLRLHGGPHGSQVKPGDSLVTLVPEAAQVAVELTVDGNDLPLVHSGEDVRIIFEGWPAVNFSGWPGMSLGVFHGELAFVDAADDGSGGFRVVVLPSDTGPPWPQQGLLRQGVQAKGWVMLGRVRLGYEMWRQINGFPASPPKKKKGKGGAPPSSKKPRASKDLK